MTPGDHLPGQSGVVQSDGRETSKTCLSVLVSCGHDQAAPDFDPRHHCTWIEVMPRMWDRFSDDAQAAFRHGSAQALQTAAAALALQLKGETAGAGQLLDSLGPTDEQLAMNLMAAFTGTVVYAAAQLGVSPEEFCEQLATFGASGATGSDQR